MLPSSCSQALAPTSSCSPKRTDADLKRTDADFQRTDADLKRTDAHLKRTDACLKFMNAHLKRTDAHLKCTDTNRKCTDSNLKRTGQVHWGFSGARPHQATRGVQRGALHSPRRVACNLQLVTRNISFRVELQAHVYTTHTTRHKQQATSHTRVWQVRLVYAELSAAANLTR